jgi:hypothetical protein
MSKLNEIDEIVGRFVFGFYDQTISKISLFSL